MLSQALDAFLEDRVPIDAAAVYPIELPPVWFLDKDGSICKADKPLRSARLFLQPWDRTFLMLRATEMLFQAALTHEPIEEADAKQWFLDRDLELHSVWTIGESVLALAHPEFLGIRPVKTHHPEDFYVLRQSLPSSNLFLFNTNGVVRLKTPHKTVTS